MLLLASMCSHLHLHLFHRAYPTFTLSLACIMLAYFQVFHATRSHFVPISWPEQLHHSTTTQNTERWMPYAAKHRGANAPFRSVWAAIYLWACCVHEYFVCCCCCCLLLPLLVDATYTYTSFGRLGALKTCLIYKMTASPPLPLFRRQCARGAKEQQGRVQVVESAIHCRCVVFVATLFPSTLLCFFFYSRAANLLEVDKMALAAGVYVIWGIDAQVYAECKKWIK